MRSVVLLTIHVANLMLILLKAVCQIPENISNFDALCSTLSNKLTTSNLFRPSLNDVITLSCIVNNSAALTQTQRVVSFLLRSADRLKLK